MPGKKLLLWVGPGMLEPPNSGSGSGQYLETRAHRVNSNSWESHASNFDELYGIMTLLRQSRISLYTFSVGENGNDPNDNAWSMALKDSPATERIGLRF